MHFLFLLVLVVMLTYLVYAALKPGKTTPVPLTPTPPTRMSHTVRLHPNVVDLTTKRNERKISDNLLKGVERNGQDIHAVTMALSRSASPFEQALARNKVLLPPEQPATAPAEAQADGDPTPVESTIVLKPEEPQSLEEYRGQEHILDQLDLRLRAMRPEQVLLKHILLTGLPGFGKTLLAKLLARQLQERAAGLGLGEVGFVETYGANLNSVSALDQIVDQLCQYRAAVWFIDEIHVMNTDLATKIYLLMEEGRYPFSGSTTPTELPPIMVIGATTDYGVLHPALKRRFGEPFMMRPLDQDTMISMALGLVPRLTLMGATEIAERCRNSGAPHEVKTMCEMVTTWADANQMQSIDRTDVHLVMEAVGIDENGLRPIDRQVLKVMKGMPRRRVRDKEIMAYGGSEADVCNMAGVDRAEFQRIIRPRLMSRGLISVRAGIGLALTNLP